MNGFFLIVIVAMMVLQNIVRKQYNLKLAQPEVFVFNGTSCLAAMAVFLVYSKGELHFTWAFIPYAVLFAVFFGMATLFALLAIRTGPLSFTSLIISYSLVIPTFLLMLLPQPDGARAPSVGALFYVGFALLLLSLLLINNYSGNNRFSFKWVLFAVLAFLGNGLCSTVQTYQQRVFAGAYKSELMIVALTLLAVLFFLLAAFAERTTVVPSLKGGAVLMVMYGVAVGLVNLLVMVLSNRMNPSLLFPLISGGNLVLTSGVSLFFYKEKLTKLQLTGLCLGIGAVVLLNM